MKPMTSREDFHLQQLAAIFNTSNTEDRAIAAARYVSFLNDSRQEAGHIRDAELHRLHEQGWGPTQVGKALGVHTTRGWQLLDRAKANHRETAQIVAKLRRRVAARPHTVTTDPG